MSVGYRYDILASMTVRKSFAIRRPLISHDPELLGPDDVLSEFAAIGVYDFKTAGDFGFSVVPKRLVRIARSTGNLAFKALPGDIVYTEIYKRLSPRRRQPIRATITSVFAPDNGIVGVELDSPKLFEESTHALEILGELSGSPVVDDRPRDTLSMILGDFTTEDQAHRWPLVEEFARSFVGEHIWFGPIPKELPPIHPPTT